MTPSRRSLAALAASASLAAAPCACDRRPSPSSSSAPASSIAAEAPAPSASSPAPPASTPAPSASAREAPSPRPAPSAVAPGPSGSARALLPGPSPSGSQSAEERERALALLLTGNTRAGDLPEAATGPGLGFDASLRRNLTTVELSAPSGKPPSVRLGAPTVTGKLPREVIARIVRQSTGRLRFCYEQGLRINPTIQGRVTVRFVIGKDGSVQMAADGGSDLPEPGVISCVTRAFHQLAFPAPESGIVLVVYPITFAPAG